MEVNIKNLILLIELEQFEEDAKEISKTIRFVFKKNFFFYSIQYYFQNVMNKDYILIKICWFG